MESQPLEDVSQLRKVIFQLVMLVSFLEGTIQNHFLRAFSGIGVIGSRKKPGGRSIGQKSLFTLVPLSL